MNESLILSYKGRLVVINIIVIPAKAGTIVNVGGFSILKKGEK